MFSTEFCDYKYNGKRMTVRRQVQTGIVAGCVLCLVILVYRIQLFESGSPRQLIKQKIKKLGVSLPQEKKQKVEHIFEERRLHLEKECKRLRNSSHLISSSADVAIASQRHMVLVPDKRIMFCASKKSGSSFLSKVAKSLTAFNMTTDPFASKVPKSWTNKLRYMTSLDDVERELFTTTNVLFVRDPYSRLYSAWLDKFYNPNPYFWYDIRHNTIEVKQKTIEVKQKANNIDLKCGTSVSFQAFIDGIYNTYVKYGTIDLHFLPSYKPCLVCHVQYQIMAKFEDYFNEISNVLAITKLGHKINTDDMENKANEQIIRVGVQGQFKRRNATSKCLSFKECLKRFWKRLVARGILDKRSYFPLEDLTDKAVELKTIEEVTDIILKAYKEFEETEKTKTREESMAAAYNDLPEQSYIKIMTMFNEDFLLFGYDKTRRFHYNGDFEYF